MSEPLQDVFEKLKANVEQNVRHAWTAHTEFGVRIEIAAARVGMMPFELRALAKQFGLTDA